MTSAAITTKGYVCGRDTKYVYSSTHENENEVFVVKVVVYLPDEAVTLLTDLLEPFT